MSAEPHVRMPDEEAMNDLAGVGFWADAFKRLRKSRQAVTGAIIPPIPPLDFGIISSASSKVSAE